MDYGCGGNDGVLLGRSGEYIRTAHWSASPHHSTLSHSHQHNHPQQASMSFNDSSSCMDNVLGMIHGESSTIPPSHYKASAHTPASRPQGRQTPKPPRTSGFPRQAVTPTIAFNVNGYKLRRGDRFLLYPLLAEVSGRAQSKTVRHDRFKDLYLRDFVHAGKMIWRDRYRNVELTHFQEEMMARGLVIKHLEVDPVPEVADTCLGFTAVAMAEVFSELEKHDEEVGIQIPSSL